MNSLPLTHFLPQILQRQQEINSDIDEPVTDDLALLLLSRPRQILPDGTKVLNFYGAYWTLSPEGRAAGFFQNPP